MKRPLIAAAVFAVLLFGLDAAHVPYWIAFPVLAAAVLTVALVSRRAHQAAPTVGDLHPEMVGGH